MIKQRFPIGASFVINGSLEYNQRGLFARINAAMNLMKSCSVEGRGNAMKIKRENENKKGNERLERRRMAMERLSIRQERLKRKEEEV